ncbi:hypothetical protein BS50DRAFT_68578 [Corynespora cassiicola Philippines]|uniref:Uncharacterized protein n=1 Tax=Corynespora cassiicola Philippines TaxID=1448308 RepID=A0A2T2NFR1_CORCC|nr:hypothetical protein BS50DRAFT_68578 [Corynespora cassiicola Philippines]
MGSCAALDCTTRPVIKATTDIAGPGVLYAFLVSALLAILAIVYGYLSDSLPDWYLNETDRTVIASFQALLPSEENTEKIRLIYEKIKWIFLLGRKPSPHRKLTRRQRQELVTRFILALSDQQLATGLALLIAAIANQCTLSVWEFQLAFSLAWFSSTTHLATLDCLREYFINHGVVRNWRVFGMIVLLGLLIYSLILSTASIDETLPVQCTFYYFGEKSLYSDVPLDIYTILSASLTLILLVTSYIVRIKWSYKRVDGKATLFERTLFKMRTWQHAKKYRPTLEEQNYVVEEAVSERQSYIRRRQLERIRNSSGFKRHWLITARASAIYSESFLSLGPMLTFMVSFGFTQLYLNRWHSGTSVEIDNSMSIGQITPLILLILPVFAVAESYYEVQDTPMPDDPPSHSSSPHVRNSSSISWSLRLPSHYEHGPFELHDLESMDAKQISSDYSDLLPSLRSYFYLETKLIASQLRFHSPADDDAPATGAPSTSVTRLKAHLISSYHLLRAQEAALKITTLTSLIEFSICIFFSVALGILVYIEGGGEKSTIAGLVLFVCWLIYEVSGIFAYLKDAWITIGDDDYKRLVEEARTSRNDHKAGDQSIVDTPRAEETVRPLRDEGIPEDEHTPMLSREKNAP